MLDGDLYKICGRDVLERAFCQLRALNADMLAMLERIEWEGDSTGERYCPICVRHTDRGHEPGCELAALIKRGKEQT